MHRHELQTHYLPCPPRGVEGNNEKPLNFVIFKVNDTDYTGVK